MDFPEEELEFIFKSIQHTLKYFKTDEERRVAFSILNKIDTELIKLTRFSVKI